MKTVGMRLLVRPIMVGSANWIGFFGLGAGIATSSSLSPVWLGFVSALLPASAGFAVGATLSTLKGVRHLLVEERYAAKAIPTSLKGKLELEDSHVKLLEFAVKEAILEPRVLPSRLHPLWRWLVRNQLGMGFAETFVADVRRAADKAKDERVKYDLYDLAETVLLIQLGSILDVLRQRAFKWGYLGVAVVLFTPLLFLEKLGFVDKTQKSKMRKD